MVAENSDSTSDVSEYTVWKRLVSGGKVLFYGFSAAGGTLFVVDGIQKFLEYTDGDVNQPIAYLLGVVAVLGIGFTLLHLAFSGAVARGMSLTNGS